MKYTLRKNGSMALSMTGQYEVIVPDEVANNQADFNGKTFPSIIKPHYPNLGASRKGRAMLMGSEYGLGTSGTGDMVVKIVG